MSWSGDAKRAATPYGAGDRFMTMKMPPFWERQLRPGIDAAAAALGEIAYRRLYEQGRAMSVEEATEYLLGRQLIEGSQARNHAAPT